MTRRGVPHLLLVLTLLASGAGAWLGHELGPDGRDKRQAAAYREAVLPLAQRVSRAADQLRVLPESDAYTADDVLMHSGAVQELSAATVALRAVPVPGVLAKEGADLRAAVLRMRDEAEQSRRDALAFDRDTTDGYRSEHFNQSYSRVDRLRQASDGPFQLSVDALFTPAQARQVREPGGETFDSYLLRVDEACAKANQATYKLRFTNPQQIIRNGTAFASAVDTLVRELRATSVVGPKHGQDRTLRSEVAAAGAIAPAYRELVRALELRDPVTLEHAHDRLMVGLRHSKRVAALYRGLGASWCDLFFDVPEPTGTDRA